MDNYGLIGEKLSHSLSPEIHEYIFKELNIEGIYRLIEIPRDKIKNIRDILIDSNINGVNVTIPYKEEVIKELDFISDEGKKIGAINTIFNKDGKLSGYNTDYYGFKYMLEERNIDVSDKIVTVLGTGGASKAVIAYLLDKGASKIFLVSRNPKQLYKNNEKIKIINYNELNAIKGYSIINTTPVGMFPNNEYTPVTEDIIKNYEVVVDLIYNPLETNFLKLGKNQGKVTCGGLMMLVLQAIKAEEIWQETNIDKSIVVEIYNKLLSNFK